MKIRLAFGLSTALLLAGTAYAQQAGQDQPAGDLVPPTSASDFTAGQLDAVLAGSWRSATNKARDVYRHPKATLQFFGLQPDQTVIEITPGSGWYSEILAPLLRDNGHYIAAIAGSNDAEQKQDATGLHAKFAADSAEYGKASIVSFNPKAPVLGPAGSADMVLTFRNVHNWAVAGTAPAMFKAFYTVLKPGGTLGVVDHRAAPGASFDVVKESGYLPTDYVIKLATDAGFKLDAQSEINANPKDTKDYPKGVWTLPPTLTLGDQDRAKYLAIGESDRMTLRFVKVAKAPAAASNATAH
ncbi:class I SAM-dependent methyltransferase [Dyella caseinilytica]|uniref:Class I SAM-dependent methyltransferase n=1 Tax=Dyella caseinilytica TaxID=1849581 RepID=A0ABX7GU62_9GAMM|nr:class I SAM-dependent methyltransferase [Dyella caseinilytica]QRN53292.1 class I SAM-dependent methyltransferase [Dyella caseinilytica]GGA12962.1 methyltransferase [Dyella caseinilytica]